MNSVTEIVKWINYVCASNQISPVEQNREAIKMVMQPVAADLRFDKQSYDIALQMAINQGEETRLRQMN
jgi:hypothetical protein